jgi:hypothetical protein
MLSRSLGVPIQLTPGASEATARIDASDSNGKLSPKGVAA